MTMKGFGIKRMEFGVFGQSPQIPDVSGIRGGYTQAYPFGPCLISFFPIAISYQSHVPPPSPRSHPHAVALPFFLHHSPPGTMPPYALRSCALASHRQPSPPPHCHRRWAKAERRRERQREKDWSTSTLGLESALHWIGVPLLLIILGISKHRTHLFYWIQLHLSIPQVELTQ